MMWIAIAIVLAAMIIADSGKSSPRGGYQPRPLRKGETLGSPPTGGSGVSGSTKD